MNNQEQADVLDQWDNLHRVGWQLECPKEVSTDQWDDLHRVGWQLDRSKELPTERFTKFQHLRESCLSIPSRRKMATRALIGITLLAGAYLASEFILTSDYKQIPKLIYEIQSAEADLSRRLSVALPNGGCKITSGQKLAAHKIPPTYQASFPGSGARMTWHLVMALTGISINDDFNHMKRGYEKVVAVKTHYPLSHGKLLKEDPSTFRGAMLLLRNPISAIPSFFNFEYERKNHLANHSTRAPTEDWIRYRDSELHKELNEFKQFVIHWMEKYDSREKLLLVTYEDLIDYEKGPVAATRIADFLGETDGVDPIANESIPCVWHAVVKYKDSVANPMSLRKGQVERPYTENQLAEMKAILEDLMVKFSNDGELVSILASYMDTVTNTVPTD